MHDLVMVTGESQGAPGVTLDILFQSEAPERINLRHPETFDLVMGAPGVTLGI